MPSGTSCRQVCLRCTHYIDTTIHLNDLHVYATTIIAEQYPPRLRWYSPSHIRMCYYYNIVTFLLSVWSRLLLGWKLFC